jgi:DNA-directed RNA polymerase subunit RPC12/RpoP
MYKLRRNHIIGRDKRLTEKNQRDENETGIRNTAAWLGKHEHTSRYSCKACGNPFDANLPDDVHKFSSVYQCWKFDWIEREYKCHSCSKTTTLYWHSEVHKYHDYASAEEVTRKMSNGKLDDPSGWIKRMVGY